MNSSFFQYFFYFSSALLIALVGVPAARRFALSIGAADRGEGRRIHEGVVPRLGGTAIYAAFMIPLVFSLFIQTDWQVVHHQIVGIALGATIVFALGVMDDIREMTARRKLAVEVAAAAVVYFWGVRITLLSNPFGETIHLGLLSLPVTVLWILVITNAMNLIDGLDGLAAGTGILIGTTLLILSGPKDMHIKLTLLVLIGSLLGFLRHNFPPATIFMGDSGSLFIGFFLGAFTIISSAKATATVTLLVPILAFWHPLLDMTYAVLRRAYRGLPLSHSDREHIHHKLIDRGLPKKQVVIILYVANIVVLATMLLIVRQQYDFQLVALGLLVLFGVVGLKMFGYIKFVPFVRENVSRFRDSQRRRYLSYVVRTFSANLAKGGTPGEIREHIDGLMRDFRFSSAEIRLKNGMEMKTVYRYQAQGDGDSFTSLELPLYDGASAVGRVRLSTSGKGRGLLCASELAGAFEGTAVSILKRLEG